MKRVCPFLTMVLASCSIGMAQDAYFYGAYPASSAVVYRPQTIVTTPPVVVPLNYVAPYQVLPSPTVVAAAYVPYTPVVAYSSPAYVARPVVTLPASSVVLPVSPYSVAGRETVRATRNGIDYNYREIGPWGGQRYHYSVNSKPHGYVIRERGR